jgi:hypothetical protein
MNRRVTITLVGMFLAVAGATVWVPVVSAGGMVGARAPYVWTEWRLWSWIHYRPIWSLDGPPEHGQVVMPEKAIQHMVATGDAGRFGVGSIHLPAMVLSVGAILALGGLIALYFRTRRRAA